MASYATVAELREYLTQAATGAAEDLKLQAVLDRATDIIDGELTFSYAAAGAAAPLDVRCVGAGEYLWLPAHTIGSVTAVAWLSGKGTPSEITEVITDYVELADGRLYRAAGWARGQWYRVTAPWGYGPAPAGIVEICLEIAINVWGARDSKQISDVVGIAGGAAVGYNRALTNRQRMIIDDSRRRAGEWGFA